jgi:hypothetical protein
LALGALDGTAATHAMGHSCAHPPGDERCYVPREVTAMNHFDPDLVDLAGLARHLDEAFPSAPMGSIVGRTQLRDEVARNLKCSLLEAEQMVDTMVARGYLFEQRELDGTVHWMIQSRAEG